MNIGKQIRALRMKKSVRQDELADYLGISAQAVSKWETDASLPDVTLLPRIAVYFGVTIDELFRLPDEEQMNRIENALNENCKSCAIDAPAFDHFRAFLEGCIDENRNALRAGVLLARLYNHRAEADHSRARAAAQKVLDSDPDNHGAWSSLIEAYGGACGDEWVDNNADLIEFCRSFLKQHPDSYRALYAITENLLRDDRFDDAVPYIDRLGELGNPGQHGLYTGDVCRAKGDTAAALAHWNRAVEENPDTWQVWCSRADRMKKLGRYEEALADYERSYTVQTAPRLIDGLYSRAQLFEQLGRYREAAEERRRIISVLAEEYGSTESAWIDHQNSEAIRLDSLAEQQNHV